MVSVTVAGNVADDAKKYIIESTWRKGGKYRCDRCYGPEYQNPDDEYELGCPTCGYTTHSVSLNFHEAHSKGAQ